ncbi:hypothetical protein KKH23_07635 [Patescibacteria group bacterium]|uniref:Uncharacterized protein n=1 Tax=viral metagenome TaxID=1070528 RepID=A0A6M3MB05_9ZZZZ|nr:hypothetical protein [Patescibacteria group bacterium]
MVRLADSLWEELTEKGWIAIPVWGGFALRLPGYETILVELDAPDTVNISNNELDHLVNKLREAIDVA